MALGVPIFKHITVLTHTLQKAIPVMSKAHGNSGLKNLGGGGEEGRG